MVMGVGVGVGWLGVMVASMVSMASMVSTVVKRPAGRRGGTTTKKSGGTGTRAPGHHPLAQGPASPIPCGHTPEPGPTGTLTLTLTLTWPYRNPSPNPNPNLALQEP